MKLQEWIHRLELGAGVRYLRWLLALVAFAALAVAYDSLCFRNFANAEAMDAAQLGRNIAEGRGYTTLFVRPFSMALTREHRADKSPLLKQPHRDISNAPVYPVILSALFRLTPAPADLPAVKGFNVVPDEIFIAILNQVLMGLGAMLVFRLALGWFDRAVAWVSAILFVLTEMYWHFSISGLSTMLLIDVVLLLVWLLSRFEQASRENASAGKLFTHAMAIGLLVGLAMLTRYSVGWLIVPTLIFVTCTAARNRLGLTAAVFCAFALTVTPWIVRNTAASGWPFGTATFCHSGRNSCLSLRHSGTFAEAVVCRFAGPSMVIGRGHGPQRGDKYEGDCRERSPATGRQLALGVFFRGPAGPFSEHQPEPAAMVCRWSTCADGTGAGPDSHARCNRSIRDQFREPAGAVLAAGARLRRRFVFRSG